MPGSQGSQPEKSRKTAGNGAGRGSAAENGHVSLEWDSPLFTKQQAADYVQCTPRYLERQIRAGRLRALKPTGKLLRIRRSDLDSFLESGATIKGDT